MDDVFFMRMKGFSRYVYGRDDESLNGEGSLNDAVSFVSGGETEYLHDIEVAFKPDRLLKGDATSFINAGYGNDGEFMGYVGLFIPQSDFDRLKALDDSAVITIEFHLPTERVIPDGKSWNHYEASQISISYVQDRKSILTMTSKDISETIQSTALSNSSQVAFIVRELMDGLNQWLESNPVDSKKKDDYIEVIQLLISELRGCHITNGEMTGLFYRPLDEFKSEISELSDERQKEAKNLYDSIWNHGNITRLISSGDINDYAKITELNVENMELVSGMYLSNPWMKSKTLEWILIDALLFAETVEFAKVANDVPTQKFFNILGRSVWETVKFAFSEGIALAITAFVSSIIDSTQGITFWIAFATITIIRWLRPMRFEQIKAKAKNRILLFKMIGAYESKMKSYSFNPRLLRELLYDLEKKGAVYSPWVYHLLDRIIAR